MKRRLFIAAGLAAGLVLPFGSASLSSAAPTAAGKDHKISVVFDAAQLDAVRHGADKARKAHQESSDLKALRGELARRAAKNGETLLDEDTESFALSPDVSMAVPKGLKVKSVNVHSDGDKVVADVESEDTTAETVTTQGQGMATWEIKSSGTYIIKISGKGFMESKWLKRRLEGNDGSSRYDYVAFRRTGLGQPYEISGVNQSVTGLYISAHATDGTAGNVVDRIDQSPQQDFSGNCSGSYDISVSVLGVGAGGSFADCDHYDIAFSATEPAYYRNYMEQGAVFSGGNRAVGFQIAVKVLEGKALNFTIYQRLEMARFIYPADKCSSWDADATC